MLPVQPSVHFLAVKKEISTCLYKLSDENTMSRELCPISFTRLVQLSLACTRVNSWLVLAETTGAHG